VSPTSSPPLDVCSGQNQQSRGDRSRSPLRANDEAYFPGTTSKAAGPQEHPNKEETTYTSFDTEAPVYQWLNEARQEIEEQGRPWQTHQYHAFLDQLRIIARPYEHVVYQKDDGSKSFYTNHMDGIDVVWCCMLYGRRFKVQEHLAMCTLLGYQLRGELRPAIAAQGKTFENVLFITPESLEESELKIVAEFWSIKVVDLPEVDESRIKKVSYHLTDPELDPRHVYLKYHAFGLPFCSLSIISDVDCHVLNASVLAEGILQFMTDPSKKRAIAEREFAVMTRLGSELLANVNLAKFKERNTWERHNVSYCWALIKPSERLQARYEKFMNKPPLSTNTSTILSDQDLLGEFSEGLFVHMPHHLIMFPSWFAHSDWCNIHMTKLTSILNKKKVSDWEIQPFAMMFGAVHYSSGFKVTDYQGRDKKRQGFLKGVNAKGHQYKVIAMKGPNKELITAEKYVDHFLLPLYSWLYTDFHCLRQNLIHKNILFMGADKQSKTLLKMNQNLQLMDYFVLGDHVTQEQQKKSEPKSLRTNWDLPQQRLSHTVLLQPTSKAVPLKKRSLPKPWQKRDSDSV